MDRLTTYRAKRDPARTSEPFDDGAPPSTALRYSIQNHDATRLHWDLRLEWDGALLSWAITRGPSLDPTQKRLSVRTEDHPLSYLTYEGTIPKGEYGAGTVMLWDIGSWRPMDDIAHGLKKGHLRFKLYGRRMTGAWDLVRIKGKPTEKKRENWLLIKVDDAAAHQPDPVERYTTSVATNRTFAEIADDAPAHSFGPDDRLAAPKPQAPMLATLAQEPPEGGPWLHELKIDGYRGMVQIGKGLPVIRTRNGLDWSDRFEPLLPAFQELPCRSALIDGEIIAGAGQVGFSALQAAIKAGGPFAYVAFDLLYLDGTDLRKKALTDRRGALEKLLSDVPPMGLITLSDIVEDAVDDALSAVCAAGGEGIVSKLATSAYRGGRSDAWRKVKCANDDDFLIVGWQPSSAKGRAFASLLLASSENGKLSYRGKVGTGFDEATQQAIADALVPYETTQPPVIAPKAEVKGAKWVQPVLSAQITFAELTRDGRVRHAVFHRLREDKMPTEKPSKTVRVAKPGASSGVKVAGVAISNPDRVVFPKPPVTKGEIAEYYASISGLMLPFVKDRPLSLVRLPEGLGGESFFQKHAGKGFPESVRQVNLPDEAEPAMYIADKKGLVSATQMGAVEFHIRGVRYDRPDRPDRVVFDLDPDEGLSFSDVKDAAVLLRDRLSDLGLASWAMLSGGKGVHVVCNLRRTADWDMVTLFARTMASVLAQQQPERFIATMSKAKRNGKIFIDWPRNQPQSTAISPYSVRARSGAPVAMPVSWDVLQRTDKANAYDIRTALSQAKDVAPDYPPPASLIAAVHRLTAMDSR
ncbi:MAG: DNA ligase D [Paracoccus denitrificans]|nr:MAG: DNA ligase D [Paracoccus denitrificans]PZO82790.1 MAG: DNA ligase D [Paracoccus denitrificans]